MNFPKTKIYPVKYLFYFARIFVLLLFASPCLAADYYCDLTLSGDGSGTTGDPWQWSQAINSENVNPGDTVYLRGTGGSVTITSNSDANGSAGNQIVYTQWGGQTQAQFTSIMIAGSNAPYYEFSGLTIDAGTGTTWVTAISENLSGSGGEITFDGNNINGFRSSLYSGGDFYPYYLGDTEAKIVAGVFYNSVFSNLTNVTLEIKNNTFTHGRRILSISGCAGGSTLIENNTFDRAGEDFISLGGTAAAPTDGVMIRGNTFAQTSPADRVYAVYYWSGKAIGTWAGHEGETVTQDNTNASSIYVGQYDGKIYVLVDDSTNVPIRSNTDVWRLDSDPDNTYWISGRVIEVVDYSLIDSGSDSFTVNSTTRTAGTDWVIGASNVATASNIASDINGNVTGFSATAYENYVRVTADVGHSFSAFSTTAESSEMTTTYYFGDNSHNDHIQIVGNVDDIIIEKNFFQGVNPVAVGYGIKFDGTSESENIDNSVFRNNIMHFNGGSGVYCIMLGGYANDAVIANNIIINKGFTTGGIRYRSDGTYTIANNIITGGLDPTVTNVTAYNNIFENADPWSGVDSLTNQDLDDLPIGNNRYFTDYANGDYTPYNSDSPQVDRGLAVYAPSDDYLDVLRPQGNGYDIGAFEYQVMYRADVDNSSAINTTDALLTLRNSLGLSMNGTAWQASSTTGDVNCDGVSNSTDALLILRHSLGLSMSGTGWCE